MRLALENKTDFILNPFGAIKEIKDKQIEEERDYLSKLMLGDHRQNKLNEAKVEAKKEVDAKGRIIQELAAMREKERENVTKELEKAKKKEDMQNKMANVVNNFK